MPKIPSKLSFTYPNDLSSYINYLSGSVRVLFSNVYANFISLSINQKSQPVSHSEVPVRL